MRSTPTFSPDGSSLVTGGSDSNIFLWDTDPGSWLSRGCRIASRNLTDKEWSQFLGSETYRQSCDVVALVAAGEAASPEAVPSPLAALPSVPWRINVGGRQSTDSDGKLWHGDQEYQTTTGWGYVDATGGSGTVDRRRDDPALDVSSIMEEDIFATERWDMQRYRIEVPNGTYDLVLSFAETFENIDGPGQRVFDVSVEETPVVSGLDIFAEVGSKVAMTKLIKGVVVKDGDLSIEFTPGIESPIINGIEVLPAGSLAPASSGS